MVRSMSEQVSTQRIAGTILYDLDFGVHALGVSVQITAPARAIGQDWWWEKGSVGSALDQCTLVEHERMQSLAEDWVHRHARRLTEDFGPFTKGDRLIDLSPKRGKFRPDYRIPNSTIYAERVDTVTSVPADLLDRLDPVPLRSPLDASGDSADLAVAASVTARMLEMWTDVAITADVAGVHINKIAALAEKRRGAASANIKNLMISRQEGLFPGERSDINLWVARRFNDAAAMLCAISAGESPSPVAKKPWSEKARETSVASYAGLGVGAIMASRLPIPWVLFCAAVGAIVLGVLAQDPSD